MVLKLLVVLFAGLYVLAAAASIIELRKQEGFQAGWTVLAGFWLFLAVGTWRLSKIAKTITMTLLWVVVLGFTFLALQPLYFPEWGPLTQIPQFLRLPGFERRPEFYLVFVVFALMLLWALSKYKEEFR